MKHAAVSPTLHQTRRRLLLALFVTLACLPVLVIDVFSSSTTSASENPETAIEAPEPSLVLAEVTTTTQAPTTTTTVAPVEPVAAPATTTSTIGRVAPPPIAPPPPTVARTEADTLACLRWRESRNNYGAVDATGTYMGAYQIYQGGWNAVASRNGRDDLVGVQPHMASPADQDFIATALLRASGTAPWGGACR